MLPEAVCFHLDDLPKQADRIGVVGGSLAREADVDDDAERVDDRGGATNLMPPAACSGDMNDGVPMTASRAVRSLWSSRSAKPKSATFGSAISVEVGEDHDLP